MNDSKISVRYAKAFFLSALEEKNLDSVIKDVNLINTSFEVEGFKEMLESPVVKTSEKKTLVEKVFAKNVSGLSFKFLELIFTNKREIYLEGILRNFKVMYRKHMGIKNAELIVPYEVSKEYREKFLTLLEKVFDSNVMSFSFSKSFLFFLRQFFFFFLEFFIETVLVVGFFKVKALFSITGIVSH